MLTFRKVYTAGVVAPPPVPDTVGWYYGGGNAPVRSVRYINGEFIVVKDGGFLATSVSPSTGKFRLRRILTSPLGAPLRAIAFGAGLYVTTAGVSGQGIAYATDLDGPWTVIGLPGIGASTIQAILYANGYFYAGGALGYIATSPDGITWTQRVSGTGKTINCIAYGAGKYVLGLSGGGSAEVIHNTDPLASFITVAGATNGAMNGITFAEGLFVAAHTPGSGNTITTSPDGVTWSNRPNAYATTMNDVAYVPNLGRFVAVGGGAHAVQSSSNGMTGWGAEATPPSPASAFSNRSIATNGATVVIGTEEGGLYITSDLNSYRAVSTFATGTHGGIGKAFGSYFISSNGVLYKSSDLTNWVQAHTHTFALQSSAFSGAELVFVGVSGRVVRTTEGATFANISIPGGGTYNAVCWDGTQFVAVGQTGVIATSPNGITWTTRTSGTASNLTDVTSINGVLIATGQTNAVLRSIDGGVNWTTQAIGFPGIILSSITHNGTRLVATPTSGLFVYRSDNNGVTWTSEATAQSFIRIRYGGGRFMAIGVTYYGTSPSGIGWNIVAHSGWSISPADLIHDADNDIFIWALLNTQGFMTGRNLATT